MTHRYDETKLLFFFSAIGLRMLLFVQSLSLWIPAGCLCLGALGKYLEEASSAHCGQDQQERKVPKRVALGRLLRIAGVSGVGSFGMYAVAVLGFR
jgi:hypothetical protein